MIKEFFQDDKGCFSMMRLCTFILVVGGLTMAFVYPDYEGGYISIIGLGLSGKVSQKIFGEKKTISDDTKTP